MKGEKTKRASGETEERQAQTAPTSTASPPQARTQPPPWEQLQEFALEEVRFTPRKTGFGLLEYGFGQLVFRGTRQEAERRGKPQNFLIA